VDYGNAHVYAGHGLNVWARDMPYWLPIQALLTPGKPMVVTETGYTMDDINVNEVVGAKYILNTLVGNAAHGLAMTYLYELVDMDPRRYDGHLGLFRSNWRPKPAAVAVHNFTETLVSAGEGTPTSRLTLSKHGIPNTMHSLIIGSDTTTDIILWNEQTIWDAVAKTPLFVKPVEVKLDFDATVPSVTIFDPIISSSPVAQQNNVRSLFLEIPDHPLIVRFPAFNSDHAVTINSQELPSLLRYIVGEKR
jgi:hypothetical protein